MEANYVQHERTQQLISAARLLFALLALAIAAIDPGVAGVWPRAFLASAAIYVLYAIAMAWRSLHRNLSRRTILISHGVDLAAATVLVGLTQTPISPLFSLYLFPLFAATLRFRPAGVIATGVAVIALYIPIVLLNDVVRRDPAFVVVRLTYVAVATVLLAAVRRQQQRMHDDLLQLAGWRRGVFDSVERLLDDALGSASTVLRAPRCAVVFEQHDEPWTSFGRRDATGFELTREAPDFESVTAEFSECTFFCGNASHPRPTTYVSTGGDVERRHGLPVPAVVRERLAMRSVLSAPFAGESVRGRLFFLDRIDVTHDEMILSEIIARLFASHLDELALLETLRGVAIMEERTRLARDLHDTLLQSLTAMGLQIQVAQGSLDRDPEQARKRLALVQDLIAQDHEELRSFIRKLRPQPFARDEPLRPLRARVDEVAHRFRQQWSLEIMATVRPADATVERTTENEVVALLHESLANVAKHARASRVDVTIHVFNGRAELVVADDGRGFPFHGTFDLWSLARSQRGPLVLRERVAALGGTLELQSNASGTRIAISIPAGLSPLR